MATNSKVCTVPEESQSRSDVNVEHAPAVAKHRKKVLETRSSRHKQKQFPSTSRHQNGTKKKKTGARKIVAAVQQTQYQVQKASSATKSAPKHRRSSPSSSAPLLPKAAPTKKTSSLAKQASRGTTTRTLAPPPTRGAHLKAVHKTRKRSSSVDITPTASNGPSSGPSPTPSEGKMVRKFSTARVSSLKSAVQASKQALRQDFTGSKASSLNSALAASKHKTLDGKKESILSEKKHSRKTSPTVQKRIYPLKAKKSKEAKNSASMGELPPNDLDSSLRSVISSKSLPAKRVSARQKTKNKGPFESPPLETRPNLSTKNFRKTPQPQQSATQGQQQAKSNLRSRTLMQKNNARKASLSPKRHSHGKVQHTTKQQMEMLEDLSHGELSAVSEQKPLRLEASDVSTGDFLLGIKHPKSPKRHSHEKITKPMEMVGNMSHGVLSTVSEQQPLHTEDPLRGTKILKSPKTNDLKTVVESQKKLDERYYYNPNKGDDLPRQRNSDASLTYTSTTTLSSTCHEHMLTPKRAKAGRVIIRKTKNGLDVSSSHVTSYAGDIATTTSIRLAPRPSLAPNMLINPINYALDDGRSSTQLPKPTPIKKTGSLTFFGNPLVPIDIVEKAKRTPKLNLMHHKDALEVLDQIKSMKRQQLMVKLDSIHASAALPVEKLTKAACPEETRPELKCIQLLKTAGTSTSAILSMTGFKGGALEDQINHDRSLIVSPFYLRNHCNSMVRRRLMGVFDGHAEKGSQFAEHCQQLLPSLLSRKLSEAFKKAVDDIAAGGKTEDEVTITKRVLMQSFLAMDESSPKDAIGGCTATVVYQQGQKVFVANTGDSRSCIVVYRRNPASPPPTNQQTAEGGGDSKSSLGAVSEVNDSTTKPVRVVYISREDKPDLPDERLRLEARGGEIVDAEKNKSAKVKLQGAREGKATATLSMSRSIGDSQFTRFGVIPDPIVDVIDLKDVLEQEKKRATSAIAEGIDESADDHICVFALCASDGMMIESVEDAEAVASELAPSLFNDDAPHPLTACQDVIRKSAATWDRRNKGKFRDDITVAVTVLRSPSRR